MIRVRTDKAWAFAVLASFLLSTPVSRFLLPLHFRVSLFVLLDI